MLAPVGTLALQNSAVSNTPVTPGTGLYAQVGLSNTLASMHQLASSQAAVMPQCCTCLAW